MTSTQQRAALQRQIWQIANDVRGSVDGWDFKQYVLGTLFYRFISEKLVTIVSTMPSWAMMSLPQISKMMPLKQKATSFTQANSLPI